MIIGATVSHTYLLLLTVHIVFSQRLFVGVDTGGSGILQLTPILLVAVVPVLTLTYGSGRPVVWLLRGRGSWGVLGYAFAAMILPVLGVMLNDYRPPTLLAALEGLVPLAALLIGSHFAARSRDFERLFPIYFTAACVMQAVAAIAQFAHSTGWVSIALLDVMREWDMTVQRRYSEAYIISGRSIGMYINPNVLGIWSALAVGPALYLLRGGTRVACLMSVVATLLLSQSRTAIAAVVASGALVALIAVWRWMLGGGRLREAIIALGGAVGVAFIITIAAMLAIRSGPEIGVLTRMADRLQQGYAVLVEGADADANMRGRLDVWVDAVAFHQANPWGTLGPPQVRFPRPIDSDYFRVLLQGGMLYVFLLLLALAGGASWLWRGRSDVDVAVGMMAVAVLVCAVAAQPLATPGIGVFWLLLGYTMAGDARRSNLQYLLLTHRGSDQERPACQAL